MPGAGDGAIAFGSDRDDRIGRRVRRARGGHLSCHARGHLAEACVTRLVLLLLAPLAAGMAGDAPRLFFSRSFPGGAPPYIQVTVEKNGDVEYRESADDELPVKYKIGSAETDAIFALAEKLDRFKHPLEAPMKVAFMGTKTFRYE